MKKKSLQIETILKILTVDNQRKLFDRLSEKFPVKTLYLISIKLDNHGFEFRIIGGWINKDMKYVLNDIIDNYDLLFGCKSQKQPKLSKDSCKSDCLVNQLYKIFLKADENKVINFDLNVNGLISEYLIGFNEINYKLKSEEYESANEEGKLMMMNEIFNLYKNIYKQNLLKFQECLLNDTFGYGLTRFYFIRNLFDIDELCFNGNIFDKKIGVEFDEDGELQNISDVDKSENDII